MNRVPHDVDLFGEPVPHPHRMVAGGYAYRPGTGPAGERCGTCACCYLAARRNPKARHYKCALVTPTFGPGTDIVLKSPACWAWRKKS